jgi:hypothetical protein
MQPSHNEPILSVTEREAINAGRWFTTLSPSLRHDILRLATVKRFKDGAQIYARGDAPHDWFACAKGAVRMSSTSLAGARPPSPTWSPVPGSEPCPPSWTNPAPATPTPTATPRWCA